MNILNWCFQQQGKVCAASEIQLKGLIWKNKSYLNCNLLVKDWCLKQNIQWLFRCILFCLASYIDLLILFVMNSNSTGIGLAVKIVTNFMILLVEIIPCHYQGMRASEFVILVTVSSHLTTWVLATISLLLLHCCPSVAF